jgi:hypothetical protein
MATTAELRDTRERIVREHMDSLAGRVTTVLLHPVTIGRALVRSLGGR